MTQESKEKMILESCAFQPKTSNQLNEEESK